ncbi:MAG TPA: FGGY family carbohydrate kinase [Tepidisphaeraceae bacterium]|nr:FGGY family carbohydrate kinase [Tepidisphaeraceae bacterium]
MNLLGLDIGSSSVKAAVLRDGKVRGKIIREPFQTRHTGVRVEVDPNSLLKAVSKSIQDLGPAAKRVDWIALSVMSPSWIAMDAKGKPLTPIITHQDRRSTAVAIELERRIGKERFLNLSGNRPIPGGISVTTWVWFDKNEPGVMRRADLVGHLNTFIHRQMTGARVVDPSNASFMGLYSTPDQSGWSDELCEAVGISKKLLPAVQESNRIAGNVTAVAATRFGLSEGTPVLAGLVDTSSAMLLSGAAIGQLTNNCGSTDVLGLCAARAVPNDRLLTRALGVGPKWMSVSTIAAAGSSMEWMKNQVFPDLDRPAYWKLVNKLSKPAKGDGKSPELACGSVRFEPYLAGDRTSVEQRQGAFTGLTLSSTREQMLAAVIQALAEASAARLELFHQLKIPMRRKVMLTGGSADGLSDLLHKEWKGQWDFYVEAEATLRGLATLEPQA